MKNVSTHFRERWVLDLIPAQCENICTDINEVLQNIEHLTLKGCSFTVKHQIWNGKKFEWIDFPNFI